MAMRKRLGELLLEAGRITAAQLGMALKRKEQRGGRLASSLLELGLAGESELLTLLAAQQGVPAVDLSKSIIALEHLALVPRAVAEQNLILPLGLIQGQIALGMVTPDDVNIKGEVQFVTGRSVKPYLVLEGRLKKVLALAYAQKEAFGRFWRGERAGQPVGSEPADGYLCVIAEKLPEPDVEIVIDEDPGPMEVADTDIVEVTEEVAAKPVVLVVDDDPEIVTMLQVALQKQGYEVLTANRGDTALETILAKKPHLVLLDAMLPGMHGFEVCQKVKSSPAHRQTRIIMLSALYRGWRIAGDIRSVYGADDYVEKPFHLRPLLAKVKAILAGRHEAAEAEENETVDARAFYDRGMALYQDKKYDEAETVLREACANAPLSARVHYALANVLIVRNRVFEAMHEYEETIALKADMFTPLRNLAILYQRQGFRRKAAEMWERALNCAPDDETKVNVREQLLKLI